VGFLSGRIVFGQSKKTIPLYAQVELFCAATIVTRGAQPFIKEVPGRLDHPDG
jgi:hypothetical protein